MLLNNKVEPLHVLDNVGHWSKHVKVVSYHETKSLHLMEFSPNFTSTSLSG
jgi:hypothetical protein